MNAAVEQTPITNIINDAYIPGLSRINAIEEGLLIDVSKQAKSKFFNVPVALTQNVFHYCIHLENGDYDILNTDENRRLNRLLEVIRFKIRSGIAQRCTDFQFEFTFFSVRDGMAYEETVELEVHIGIDNSGESVITVAGALGDIYADDV